MVAADRRGAVRPGGGDPGAGAAAGRRRRQAHVLVLVIHHIATDGWSTGILARDLGAAYAARRAGPGAGLGAAAGAVRRLRDLAAGAARRSGRPGQPAGAAGGLVAGGAGGAPAELALPADRPRPAVPSHRGHAVPLAVPAEVHARAGGAGPSAGRDVVHGGAGGGGGAAVAAGRRGGHPGRDRWWRAGPTPRWMTWSGSSSTRWCCARTCPGTRRSASCWGGCGSSGWGRWSIRMCRSSGWWRSWRRTGRWPATRCSR